MSPVTPRYRQFVAPRWLLVVAAFIGATLGWFAIPYFKRWLAQFAHHGSFATIFASAVELTVCYVLGHAVADVLTDIHDYLRRNGGDPLLDRIKVVNGRVPWIPTIAFIWLHIETLLVLTLFLGVLPWAAFGGGGSVSATYLAQSAGRLNGIAFWQDTAGIVGFGIACYSILSRNAPPPVLPLPYRWLGLSRYLRPNEIGTVRMAWSRSRQAT